MSRLTNSIDYCAMHCDFGKRGGCFFKDKSKCYEKSVFDKLKAYEEKEEKFCKWRLIDEESNIYDASCRNPHILINGSSKDNNYAYCPYCGRKIKEV